MISPKQRALCPFTPCPPGVRWLCHLEDSGTRTKRKASGDRAPSPAEGEARCGFPEPGLSPQAPVSVCVEVRSRLFSHVAEHFQGSSLRREHGPCGEVSWHGTSFIRSVFT